MILLIQKFQNKAFIILYVMFCLVYGLHMMRTCKMICGLTRMVLSSRKDTQHLHTITNELFAHDLCYVKIVGSLPTVPVIFAVNYPNEFMEYMYFMILEKRNIPVTMVIKDLSTLSYPKRLIFGSLFNDTNYISIPADKKNMFGDIQKDVEEHVYKYRRSVWVYPERTGFWKKKYDLTDLRLGFFAMAEQLQIPVVPLACSHLSNPAGEIYITVGPFLHYMSAEQMQNETFRFLRSSLAKYKRQNA